VKKYCEGKVWKACSKHNILINYSLEDNIKIRWNRSWISNSISSRNSNLEWRRTFCIMGQQVNRSSKVKNLSESDYTIKIKIFKKIISNGLVTSIRPEARWSYQDQIIMDRTVECCIILRWVLVRGEMPI